MACKDGRQTARQTDLGRATVPGIKKRLFPRGHRRFFDIPDQPGRDDTKGNFLL